MSEETRRRVLDALSDGKPHTGSDIAGGTSLPEGLDVCGALNTLCMEGAVERHVWDVPTRYRLHKAPPHPLQIQMDLACCKADAEAFAGRGEYARHPDVKAELLEAADLIGKAAKHLNYASYLRYQHECEEAAAAAAKDGEGEA